MGSGEQRPHVKRNIISFGIRIGRRDLAEVVEHLFDAALQQSSRKTYGTGWRAYKQFAAQISLPETLTPFQPSALSQTELCLAFYMAFLILKPSINKASTIKNYETHVKYYFREQGCHPSRYTTPFLRQIRRGIDNTLPFQADKRCAFLLPLYLETRSFTSPDSNRTHTIRLATVLGFIGMLRPHTFSQLSPHSFVFVLKNGQTVRDSAHSENLINCTRKLPQREKILGFYIEFQSKTMDNALAYFPNLHSFTRGFQSMCPVTMLLEAASKNWVRKGFLKTLGRGAPIGQYIQTITASKNPISPYALRIGGRTWYISHGMDRIFTDYLGTWKAPEACARYYRESPVTVVRILLKFYRDVRKILSF